MILRWKGTFSVAMVRGRRGRRKQVRLGRRDVSLTGSGGVVALSELIERLDVLGALDAGIGPVKQRVRGATGGEVLAALAQCQLLGGHGLVALDRQRADQAAALLSALPGVASTTAAGIARRFGAEQRAGIEVGLATILGRAVARMSEERRAQLFGVDPTIDMDSSEVEVYGRQKQGVAYNYAGQKAGRPAAPGHLGPSRCRARRRTAVRHGRRPPTSR